MVVDGAARRRLSNTHRHVGLANAAEERRDAGGDEVRGAAPNHRAHVGDVAAVGRRRRDADLLEDLRSGGERRLLLVALQLCLDLETRARARGCSDIARGVADSTPRSHLWA